MQLLKKKWIWDFGSELWTQEILLQWPPPTPSPPPIYQPAVASNSPYQTRQGFLLLQYSLSLCRRIIIYIIIISFISSKTIPPPPLIVMATTFFTLFIISKIIVNFLHIIIFIKTNTTTQCFIINRRSSKG